VSRAQRLTFLAIAVAIAVIAVVVLVAGGGGGDDEQEAAATPTPTATATATAEGEDATSTPTPTATPRPKPPLLVQGNPRTLRFTEGERIRFRVKANQADEVHVHGYDLMKDVEPGQTVTFAFPATITGIFEIELEDAGLPLGSLRVDPR
jgi:FtsP/CotA-like multicopper oxidase with cupredoxin domain